MKSNQYTERNSNIYDDQHEYRQQSNSGLSQHEINIFALMKLNMIVHTFRSCGSSNNG